MSVNSLRSHPTIAHDNALFRVTLPDGTDASLTEPLATLNSSATTEGFAATLGPDSLLSTSLESATKSRGR